jgi:hypothetical protein
MELITFQFPRIDFCYVHIDVFATEHSPIFPIHALDVVNQDLMEKGQCQIPLSTIVLRNRRLQVGRVAASFWNPYAFQPL